MPNGSPRFRNIALLIASLAFYAWGEPMNIFLMAVETAAMWWLGLQMDRLRGSAWQKPLLVLSAVISIGPLALFKYSGFILSSVNSLAGTDFSAPALTLPIGISFYTFQLLSYSIDLYRGDVEPERNILDFAAYVALFPQLIAGPIVRYADVASELASRKHTVGDFAVGARRFSIGIGKKVLMSNTLGELAGILKASNDNSLLGAWLYAVAYALHIYFDFSGYSDMAIGIGRMLGFRYMENFNYPYVAKSVTEYWRRWHISLSSWFRDYVYIPMGGSRVSPARRIANILTVWLLTGLWHGANWNFVLWGGFFGIVLILEKHLIGKLLDKCWPIARHAYVMLVVCLSWALFDAQTLSSAGGVISRMLGFGSAGLAGNEPLYYLKSYAVPLILGIVGATPAVKLLASKLESKSASLFLQPLATAILLLASTAFLVDGSFNPFIYFRF
jgi:alginate O-acetyltransferase complex protein AlgI